MKKILFCSALAAVALSSCSSDDFMGDTPGNVQSNSANSAIKFDGNAGKISRATSNTGTPENMLDYQFKIYGVKSGDAGKYSKVFEDYSIWWNTTLTTSNTNKWEYVGSGTITTGVNNGTTIKLGDKSQTIKYWDYASKDYHFVAGSPISAFTYKLKEGTGDIESATITSLGGHITAKPKEASAGFAEDPSPVYVAEPVVVTSANYKNAVKFTFVRQQTKVRVGIYETIPGYSISSIKFYPYDDNKDAFSSTPSQNIVLTTTAAGYFKGGSSVSGKINYDWSEPTPKYTFEYETAGLTESKNWYGGKFANGVPATAATASTETGIEKLYGTDAEMHANGYFTVLPTPSTTEAKPILIKCDYTLTSVDGSNETINVKGATAAIPAAYSKWNTNTLYTYIFKISDNTNGYTGDDSNKTGLYPITFDAAVKAEEFGTQGTITTFTTPSITTYQAGSVEANGGIKYVANTAIKVKVTDSAKGTDLVLNQTENTVGHVAVYKLTKERTEADLQLASVTGTEIANGNKKDVTLVDENKSFTFTPDAAGFYAIQYLTTVANTGTQTPAVYTYKVVKVEAAKLTE